MSKDKDLDPSDFHVAVRRRDHTETPWYWEISAAARTKAVMSSDCHYKTMSEASKMAKPLFKPIFASAFAPHDHVKNTRD